MDMINKLSELNKYRNTTVTWEDDIDAVNFRVTLHDTCIVRSDMVRGVLVINSGGYQTATTKKRINEVFKAINLDAYLYQKDFVWYLDPSETFYDGATVRIHDRTIRT